MEKIVQTKPVFNIKDKVQAQIHTPMPNDIEVLIK